MNLRDGSFRGPWGRELAAGAFSGQSGAVRVCKPPAEANMKRSLVHPREEIMQTMERIYRYRMTTTSGGNLSIRDGSDIWITPARVDKGSLRPDDITCVHADALVSGRHQPSSEFPFHRAIYAARPDLGGIVHAHPVALVAFSISQQTPDTRLIPQARHVCGEVGFARYALPGSRQLGENIASVFAAGHDCVLLENHGVVVGGDTLETAFQRFETLEFTAKTIIQARQLGEVRRLSDEQFQQFERRKVDFEPDITRASREKELRQQLCDFVRRGCRQRLLISTEGSFSARLDNGSLLITPSQQDREKLTADDIVRVDAHKCEQGKRPSRATRVHQAIYQRHPEAGAIVFAHPVNATAFSVTGQTLDARTIPESYILLRDVQQATFGMQYDGDAMSKLVSMERPIALLENDGVVAVGTNVLDAFDRLEVLETTAEAIIASRPIGAVRCMPEEAIDELRAAFLEKKT